MKHRLSRAAMTMTAAVMRRGEGQSGYSAALASGEVKTLSYDAPFFSPQATNTSGEEAGPG